METDNMNQEIQKNHRKDESLLSGPVSDGTIEAALEAGKTIMNAIGKKGEEMIEAVGENVGNVSQVLNSAKEVIGEHGGDILEGVVKTAGEAAGNIGEFIGDAISSIDL